LADTNSELDATKAALIDTNSNLDATRIELADAKSGLVRLCHAVQKYGFALITMTRLRFYRRLAAVERHCMLAASCKNLHACMHV